MSEAAFSLCTGDESAGCEARWFWLMEYIQSNYSAVFSSYVTTIGTRWRTNTKPQDPGEPKEPFGLVPHPLLLLHIPHPPPVFHWFFFFLDCHPPLSSVSSPPFLIILSFPLFLLSFLASPCSPPFPYLLLATPLPLFSFSLVIRAPKSTISPPEPQRLPQTLFCLFYHSGWLTPPPAQTATPPETHTRNVIDRTDKTSPFHSPALPIPLFHINVLTVPPSCSISQPQDL